MFPWEIASLLLQIAQMALYLDAIDKYKEKLDELAAWLCDTADINKEFYKEFKDCDPDFYEYYKTLPDYAICESAVKRAKGVGFHVYGENLRSSFQSNRGFTPLKRIHYNQMFGHEPLVAVANHRAGTYIQERNRVQDHTLERWKAIVGAPVNIEAYSANITSVIIKQSFNHLHSAAQGFNSAGAAAGTTLYNILN